MCTPSCELLTAEADRVQAVLGPFDLQQQQEHLVVDALALGADDDVHGPGDLEERSGDGRTGEEGVYSGSPSQGEHTGGGHTRGVTL